MTEYIRLLAFLALALLTFSESVCAAGGRSSGRGARSPSLRKLEANLPKLKAKFEKMESWHSEQETRRQISSLIRSPEYAAMLIRTRREEAIEADTKLKLFRSEGKAEIPEFYMQVENFVCSELFGRSYEQLPRFDKVQADVLQSMLKERLLEQPIESFELACILMHKYAQHETQALKQARRERAAELQKHQSIVEGTLNMAPISLNTGGRPTGPAGIEPAQLADLQAVWSVLNSKTTKAEEDWLALLGTWFKEAFKFSFTVFYLVLLPGFMLYLATHRLVYGGPEQKSSPRATDTLAAKNTSVYYVTPNGWLSTNFQMAVFHANSDASRSASDESDAETTVVADSATQQARSVRAA